MEEENRSNDATTATIPLTANVETQVDLDAPNANSGQNNVRMAYARMRRAESTNDKVGAAKNFCVVACTGIAMTIIMAVTAVFHIYLVSIGSIYLKDCRAERLIPIFLIVAGVSGILRAISNWYYSWLHPKSEEDEEDPNPSPISSILSLFWLVWLICGAVWVFRTHPDFQDTTDDNYCKQLTYYTAYVYVIASLVLTAIVLAICGCACCCCIVVSCCALLS